MTRKFLSVAVCTILLATPTISHAKSKEPPKPLTVEDVVGQIKKELGEYNAFVARNPVDPPDNAVCGGNVEFEVTGVTVELATTTQRTSSGKVGAEIPIGPVTLSGGGSGSKGQKNSQSLNFTFYPAKTASQNGMWRFCRGAGRIADFLVKSCGERAVLQLWPGSQTKEQHQIRFHRDARSRRQRRNIIPDIQNRR